MNVAGLSLRDLDYLVAVADHRHFGRAAEQCAVSQPSLSAQIRKLERQLGLTLFERTSRRVLPTAQGEAVIRQARIVLAAATQLLALARGLDHDLAGRLALAAIHTIGPYLFPLVLPAIRSQWPALQLVLAEGRTAGLVEELRAGRQDAVLLSPPIEDDGLTVEALFFEPFVLALPAGHRLETQASVGLGDMDPAELLLLEEGHCLRDQALAACGLTQRSSRHATGLETLRHMVAAGAGCTAMPLLAATGNAPRVGGLIVYRRLAPPAPGRQVALAWRASDPRGAGFRRLAAALRAVLAATVPDLAASAAGSSAQ